MSDPQNVPTGSPILDEALDGGLPEQRPTLVIGGPGTGKTTLAMQFLQAGLAGGEARLFVSTEQTYDELRDAFSSFEFDLRNDRLTVTSVHAVPGRTFESDDEELVLATFEGGELFGSGFSAPFNSTRLREWLTGYAPCDRLVFDSISGLRAIADDEGAFRRGVLDLIRLFSDEFGATALMTAEGATKASTDDNPLAFTPHGVMRLWQEDLDGDAHRFLRVEKMRGADHDTRRFKIAIRPEDGIRIVPRRRALPDEFEDVSRFETGVAGLDDLLGGGVTCGDITLLEHDGRASARPLSVALVNRALCAGYSVTLLPPLDLRQDQLDDVLWYDEDTASLLDSDRLFVIDPIAQAHDTHRNVFHVSGQESYESALQTIDRRTDGTRRFGLLDVETLLDKVPPDAVESVSRRTAAGLMTGDDAVVTLLNVNSPKASVRAFFEDVCSQVLKLWQETDGMEVLKLQKAATAAPGHSRVVEYLDSPPYLQVL